MKIELEKEYENGNEVRNGVRNENGVRNWNWIFFKCLLEMKYWFESRNFLYEVRTVYYLFADSLHIFTHTENTIFLIKYVPNNIYSLLVFSFLSAKHINSDIP